MLNRRYFLSAAAIGAASAFAFSPLASAMSAQTYSDKAFSAAQAAGKPILSKLEAEPKFKGLVTFNIDFDTSKPLLRKLHVAQQSTLIVYKGKKEMGRSTGDTDPASIAALLGKVI